MHIDAKVPKRSIEARRRRIMKLQQEISREPSSSGSAANWSSLRKARAKRLSFSGKAARSSTHPEIDGKVYINDFGDHEGLEAGASTAPRSPKRTTTT